MVKVVQLTNIPAPYREQIHELVSNQLNGQYYVIYCAELEPNRNWKFDYGNYKKIFLSKRNDTYIHNNINVWKYLNEIQPDAVITTGFNPTMLYAFLWCLLNKKNHIASTDGTFNSEKSLSSVHKLVRKIVYKMSFSFIGVSKGSVELYKNYKIAEHKIFKSHLCINNDVFKVATDNSREYDIMFSGQIIERKMPLFFATVAKKIKERLGSCKVLIIGKGDMQDQLFEQLEKNKIEFYYPGFIQQQELPFYYSKAKLLLFPTLNDPWGIVANEALAAGVPVISCDNAGVADDLVIHNKNGYVLPLDEDVWADYACRLLTNKDLYQSFSENAFSHVRDYNYANAAQGIVSAIGVGENAG